MQTEIRQLAELNRKMIGLHAGMVSRGFAPLTARMQRVRTKKRACVGRPFTVQ